MNSLTPMLDPNTILSGDDLAPTPVLPTKLEIPTSEQPKISEQIETEQPVVPVMRQKKIAVKKPDTVPTWEESEPIDNAVPTWEESEPVRNDPIGMTIPKLNRLREAFNNDPMAIFNDDQGFKRDFSFHLDANYDDPELEKKKWALAAYFSHLNKDDLRFAYANLDSLIEKYNGGKVQSIDAAYNEIAQILNPKLAEPGEFKKNVHAFSGGVASLVATALNVTAMPSELISKLTDSAAQKLLPEWAYLIIYRGLLGDKTQMNELRRIARDYETIGQEQSVKADGNPDFIMDMIQGDFDKVSVMDFTKALLQSAPNMAAQVGLAVAGAPLLIPAYIGGSTFSDKYFDISENHQDMTGAQKWTNIILSSANEALLDMVTAKIAGGFMTKKAGAKIVSKGLLKYLGKSVIQEAPTEAMQRLNENIINYLSGYHGDTSKLSKEEKFGLIAGGVLEEGFIGGAWGPVFGAQGYRYAKQLHTAQNQMVAQLSSEKETLLKNPNPSDAEVNRLADVNRALDAGDLNQLVKTALNVSKEMQEIYKNTISEEELDQALKNRNDEDTAEVIPQRHVDLMKDPELIAIRDQEVLNYRTRQELKHNPQETIDTAFELMQQFPDIKLEIVSDVNAIPADVLDTLESRGMDIPKMRAWVDGDTVYLRSDNVTPSEVARVVGHEVIGHVGLKAVFGENFSQLLDQVYKTHAEEIAKLSATYNRDLETVENQRYLTEEFLANMANAEIKPNWWKEFLSKVKNGLRKIKPFQNMRFTDGDIEAMLMRSARAMRKQNQELDQQSTGPRFDMSDRTLDTTALPDTLNQTETMTSISYLKKMAGYTEAKEKGDARKAKEIARILVNRSNGKKNIELLKSKLDLNKEIVFIPVINDEEAGNLNQLPLAYAHQLKNIIGGELSEAVVKVEGSKNTGEEKDKRAKKKYRYEGFPLNKNSQIVLVDDVYTSGSTTLALMQHLIPNGYNVVALTTFGASKYGKGIKITPDTIEKLKSVIKLTDEEIKRITGNELTKLTNAEALSIINDKNIVDKQAAFIRRYAKAEGEGSVGDNGRNGQRGTSQESRQTEQQVSFDPDPDSESAEPRFAMAEYSEADQKSIIAILRPFVGYNMEHDDATYLNYLSEHGIADISRNSMREFVIEARDINIAERRATNTRVRDQWLYENNPIYAAAVDFAGSDDFYIVPSHRFNGEEFTGSWITPAWVQYSGRNTKLEGNRRADWNLRKKERMAKQDGIQSEVLAASIARESGGDAIAIENDIIDFFRDLKKTEFRKQYTKHKNDLVMQDKLQEQQMKEEWDSQEQAYIESEVVNVLERGQAITEEWINENRKVYDELYQQLFDGKEAPAKLNPVDLETINIAITEKGLDASVVAKAYKKAREKSYQEYMSQLAELKQAALDDRTDALKLQRQAMKFAEQYLPKENRSEFSRAIMRLQEHSSRVTPTYPEGKRGAEFQNILKEITFRSGEIRKENSLANLKAMAYAVRAKRNWKGIVTSIIPSVQQQVDRILKVLDLNLAAINNIIEYNTEQISELEGNPDKTELLNHYIEDNSIMALFGNLKHRSVDDVTHAEKVLENIIHGGKAEFRQKLNDRMSKIHNMQTRAISDATGGTNQYDVTADAKGTWKLTAKNMPLETLLQMVSSKTEQDFWDTVAGELNARVFDSTQDEQTRLRHNQEWLDSTIEEVTGAKGKALPTRMRLRGKFFRKVNKTVKNSGVFVNQYTRKKPIGKKALINEIGVRQRKDFKIHIEDYQWNGKTMKGARSFLNDIENGVAERIGNSYIYQGNKFVSDASVIFLRQQLADFDAGLQKEYQFFNEEGDDANFNRMIADEHKEGRVVAFSTVENETSTPVELELSQASALQLLLTWEQDHYKANMEWNGWTQESIEQLKAFIDPDVLEIGYKMRDQIAKNKAELDAKAFDRYGAHLPVNENYFPAKFKGLGVNMNTGSLGLNAGAMNVNPDFLIARKFHLIPPSTDASAFASFMSNQMEQTHFLSWSDVIRDLKGVYGSPTVQKAINANFGKVITDNIVERVETLARGGSKYTSNFGAKFINDTYRYWIPAKIAINPSSIMKQMFSSVGYMNEMPVHDWVKGMSKANFANPEFRSWVKWAMETDYYKNRRSGGWNKDLVFLMNYARDSKTYNPWADAVLRFGTWGTGWADSWSTLHGGFAFYQYTLEQGRKAGLSEAEASEGARRAWMRTNNRTQQSGYLSDLNAFQADQGLFRYMTVFLTAPISMMNLQMETINKIRHGKDTAANKKKLARQILINHLVLPTLMQFTNDILRAGFSPQDWWDDAQFEDYFLGWLLGQYQSYFLVGKLIETAGGAGLNAIFGHKSYTSNFSAAPLLDDVTRSLLGSFNMIMKEEPLTEKDLLDAMASLGNFGMLAGSAGVPVAGEAGTALNALGMQGKRVASWFGLGEKKKRKYGPRR